jgi:hypothetical protein
MNSLDIVFMIPRFDPSVNRCCVNFIRKNPTRASVLPYKTNCHGKTNVRRGSLTQYYG